MKQQEIILTETPGETNLELIEKSGIKILVYLHC